MSWLSSMSLSSACTCQFGYSPSAHESSNSTFTPGELAINVPDVIIPSPLFLLIIPPYVFPSGSNSVTFEQVNKSDQFLFQNYPNPFNSSTQFVYQLPEDTRIKLVIYNIIGKEVITLIDRKQKAGKHILYWNGKDDNNNLINSGIYFIELSLNRICTIKKITLLR